MRNLRSIAPIALTTGIMVLATVGPAQTSPSIIPQPTQMTTQDGRFQITPATPVVAFGDARPQASLLIDFFAPAMGFRLELRDTPSKDNDGIQFVLVSPPDDSLGSEGYQLTVTPKSITIIANKPAGLFYGIQTLRQLLPPAVFSPQKADSAQWTIPCIRITDTPRFAWRGLLIDPARHFIPVSDVKRFLDGMAIHKFNRLQIHLTDDCGWRVEILQHPELTKFGSRMDFTEMQADAPSAAHSRFGGFYTQQDILDLVRYSARLHITLIPEIEMPAHTGAAIVSCPQLGLYPQKLSAMPSDQRWKAHEWVLAPRPESVAFMTEILAEIIDLFPSQYIHIGGDEANISHWKQSDEMQALIRRLGLKDEAELHSWFIRQLDAFLTQNARRLVGWDEILQGGLAPGAVVMSWRGQDGGIAAAKAGHEVIMAPTSHTYFDYYQGPSQTEPKAIGGDLSLEQVFRFEPIPTVLDAAQAPFILGGQGQLWGEFIPDQKHREYMAYPRAAALAEILWSPVSGRNYDHFLHRLVIHLERFKILGIHFRPLDLSPPLPSSK